MAASSVSSRRNSRRSRRQVAEINVVPYIDVMLVLLVIFMITAPLLRTAVEIDLPDADIEASSAATGDSNVEPLVLTVNKDGIWFLNVAEDPDLPIDRAQAESTVSAIVRLNPERRVVVAGDTNADYGQIMQGMVMLKRSGATAIDLITEPTPDQP